MINSRIRKFQPTISLGGGPLPALKDFSNTFSCAYPAIAASGLICFKVTPSCLGFPVGHKYRKQLVLSSCLTRPRIFAMRLINTFTLELSEFNDSEIPKYVILSHTWGSEEVSYKDWYMQSSYKKAGYRKVHNFCKICCRNGYKWAWVDTCCIDKTSSAELSEAINSMYRWYSGKTCYAYLADVLSGDEIEAEASAFCKSRWFTRGWTLQELIAPATVYFYSRDWVKVEEKYGRRKIVARITGIPETLLEMPSDLYHYSAAQKMSWASKRKTTRIEDTAYCLLGLFDVNMPLLYGEGEKAFFRLQEEIMKITPDHTLLAWVMVG